MKLIKRTLLGLMCLVAVLLAVVYGVSESRLRRTYTVAAAPVLQITKDPVQVARGQHLVTTVTKCVDCHAQDMGGKTFIDAAPLGTVYASNVTSGKGGVLAVYTDAQLEAAIRHGVRPNGRGLFIMPSDEYQGLSDADVSAIIAYLRALPPVDRTHGTSRLGPLGRALYTAGKLPLVPAERIDHAKTGARTAPPVAATREYGQYLVSVGGCRGCHGPNLVGGAGPEPGAPPAANITPAGPMGQWTEAQFFTAIRTGTRPDGSRIKDFMPWRSMARHTDDELRAIWLYLRSVPPVESARA